MHITCHMFFQHYFVTFHASFFFLSSQNSSCKFVHSTILLIQLQHFNIHFFFHFCFFQPPIHFLYSSWPSCYLYIYLINFCFFLSIVVNLVFNDYTFKPKLPIFMLTIIIAWNILTMLLFSKILVAISSTNLGLRFCGIFPLNPSLNDITLPHICNFWPISKLSLLLTLVNSVALIL